MQRVVSTSTCLNPCCSGRWSRTEGVTYHTRATKIKVAACGRKFALRGEDDEDAVEATILELESTTPTVHKFDVKAEAEKAAE